MPPNDAVRLRHMLDAARQAIDFGLGRSREDLAQDRIRTLAIVKCIEMIGEAASRVTPDTRSQYHEIPWADIVGMRNRLIHVYFEIDLDRVCDTVANDLPPLLASLSRIFSE